jgi:hypothetical protein
MFEKQTKNVLKADEKNVASPLAASDVKATCRPYFCE